MISVTTDVGVLGEGMIRELGIAKGQSQEKNKPREGY
jgi:4-hydroxy-2-oxoheptanedioate aldolase